VISDGRLIFGGRARISRRENVALGTTPRARRRLVEGLELVERLWRGEPVTYEGRHFSLRGVRISMRRSDPAAIWLAANGDAVSGRGATGDAWLMNPHATLRRSAPARALPDPGRSSDGRPPSRHR